MNRVAAREIAPTILLCLAALSLAVLWNRVSDGRDRISYSRIETDNRCDKFSTFRPRALCYVHGLDMDSHEVVTYRQVQPSLYWHPISDEEPCPVGWKLKADGCHDDKGNVFTKVAKPHLNHEPWTPTCLGTDHRPNCNIKGNDLNSSPPMPQPRVR